MQSKTLVLLLATCCGVSACASSTTPHETFDTGLEPARNVTSLSAAETDAVCEQLADAMRANVDRFTSLTCLSLAAFQDTQAHCLSAYHDCETALTDNVEFSCTVGDRITPSMQPVCAGVTVDQVERGMTVYLNASSSVRTTLEALCAMPQAERSGFGDLSHFGASQSDLDGYDCTVNSTLHPLTTCHGSPCFML